MVAPDKLTRGMVIDKELKAEIERRYNGWDDLCQRLAGANARIELMGETALNQQKREVMLRDEVTRCRDWFETQAKVTSKGGPSSWELMLLRDERDATEEALAATEPKP